VVAGPGHGKLNLSANGGFTYTPVFDYQGTDTFAYQASQGSNILGTVTVTLTVGLDGPAIVSVPLSRTNVAGTTATFSVVAVGTPPLSYRWFRNETNGLSDGGKVSGATSATLVISNVLGVDAGSYTLVVTDVLGSATSSPPAGLTVVDPVITSQPVNQTNAAGTTALFTVEAYGTSPRYQWFRGGMAINGATGATLPVTVVSEADAAGYSVVVSNQYGSLLSRVADLVFVPEPTVLSVRMADGIAVITWSSVAGQLYRLQYKDGPGGTNWQDALPDILAAGPTATATNALGSATQRFYRVILAPVAAPPLAITSLRLADGVAVVTWNSVAGRTYRLQYKNSLADTAWQDALPDVLAIGPTTTLTNALGNNLRRFYRVMLVATGGVQPAIRSISISNGVVTVVWNSVLNQGYWLQYKDSLAETNWNTILPGATAVGATSAMTHSVGSSPRRFYRVALAP
jgi:hypothetical protein